MQTRLLTTSLAIMVLASCSSGTVQTPNAIDIHYNQTLAGYTLNAVEVSRALRSSGTSTIAYSSADPLVTTSKSSLSGKAAFLNPTNGNITPLGSTATTVMIVATDSVSGISGTIEVPIDVIAFAKPTGALAYKQWKFTSLLLDGVAQALPTLTTAAQTANPSADPNSPQYWSIYANRSQSEVIAYLNAAVSTWGTGKSVSSSSIDLSGQLGCSVEAAGQFNAGYIGAVNPDYATMAMAWFALDNVIYIIQYGGSVAALPDGGYITTTPDAGGLYYVVAPISFSTGLDSMTYTLSYPAGALGPSSPATSLTYTLAAQ